MDNFNETQAAEYIAAHGMGDPTDEGLALASRLHKEGDDYATIAHEVVFRGLTNEISE